MYNKLGKVCITNWGSFALLKIWAKVVKNYSSYYGMRQVLLKIEANITNQVNY